MICSGCMTFAVHRSSAPSCHCHLFPSCMMMMLGMLACDSYSYDEDGSCDFDSSPWYSGLCECTIDSGLCAFLVAVVVVVVHLVLSWYLVSPRLVSSRSSSIHSIQVSNFDFCSIFACTTIIPAVSAYSAAVSAAMHDIRKVRPHIIHSSFSQSIYTLSLHMAFWCDAVRLRT